MTTDINSGGRAIPESPAGQLGDELLAQMLATMETCDAPVDAYLELRDLGDSDGQIREYLAAEIRLEFCVKARRAGFGYNEVLSVRSESDLAKVDMLRRYVAVFDSPITREQVLELDRLGIDPHMYRYVRAEKVSHERALELITRERDPDDSYSDVPDGVAALLGLH